MFVVRRMATPPLSAGPLPGITRPHVIAMALQGGVAVTERRISRVEVEPADEIWLTNSLIRIRPVAVIEGHSFGAERRSLTGS